jgi:hypothetical protein
MIKKAKNTAILNDAKVIQKADDTYPRYTEFTPADPVWAESKITARPQVLELTDSDYINGNLNINELSKYNLKSITIVKGRNTVIEIIKEA